MAMKFENTSNKIIGIGGVTVLPGDTKEIPEAFEKNPILEFYKKKGIAYLAVLIVAVAIHLQLMGCQICQGFLICFAKSLFRNLVCI